MLRNIVNVQYTKFTQPDITRYYAITGSKAYMGKDAIFVKTFQYSATLLLCEGKTSMVKRFKVKTHHQYTETKFSK